MEDIPTINLKKPYVVSLPAGRSLHKTTLYKWFGEDDIISLGFEPNYVLRAGKRNYFSGTPKG
ncbi:MAG: hypothetical protein Q8R37_04145 [Nanoarchaeota archaeon]|nr:hypothetical protein [Nanoarchaeota archaeon]